MCSIFGTNIEDIDKLKKIAEEGEIRGTDASGIASVNLEENRINMIKGAVKASELNYDDLEEGDFYLGHTRKTTQGNEEDNQNNHPFISEDNTVLLAHNGVIRNDSELFTYETEVETDSFAILQQLEKEKGNDSLSIDDVKSVCEKLSGSFALSIYDITTNDLYLLRHSNPLRIMYNQDTGKLVYASLAEMIRDSYGNETNFQTFIGQIEEDIIYKFDLDSKQFTEQKEFSAKSYTYSKKTYNKKSYNKRTNWYSNESYYDEDKEEFDLEMFRYHHFSSKKPTTTKYSVNNYEKCDFCGEYYRDDSYVKAGVTKHDKNFCAYCWEEEQDTVKQTHEISDETLEEVIKFKQEQNYFEGINYFSLTESEFSELDRENQVEFIFCSECKRYFHESLDYVEYDTSKNVYKCKSCLAKDKLEGGDKNKVQVV